MACCVGTIRLFLLECDRLICFLPGADCWIWRLVWRFCPETFDRHRDLARKVFRIQIRRSVDRAGKSNIDTRMVQSTAAFVERFIRRAVLTGCLFPRDQPPLTSVYIFRSGSRTPGPLIGLLRDATESSSTVGIRFPGYVSWSMFANGPRVSCLP